MSRLTGRGHQRTDGLDPDLTPEAFISERQIREDAAQARAYLQKTHNEDLIEVLGIQEKA